jgi:hypothetical protein
LPRRHISTKHATHSLRPTVGDDDKPVAVRGTTVRSTGRGSLAGRRLPGAKPALVDRRDSYVEQPKAEKTLKAENGRAGQTRSARSILGDWSGGGGADR